MELVRNASKVLMKLSSLKFRSFASNSQLKLVQKSNSLEIFYNFQPISLNK
jgi:hypothetical protein